ncbi:MAG: hypothetical protein AAB527_03715 [Patescibacteria group bacterium]
MMKFFVWAVIIVVASSIVVGFFIVGSPATERMRRFDDDRLADLQNIQWQIVNFWQSKERFPKGLDELKDDVSGWVAPTDPETGSAYEYLPGEGYSFTLCANFSLPSENVIPPLSKEPYHADYFDDASWAHKAGLYCFERIVDPERYPPFEKPVRAQ